MKIGIISLYADIHDPEHIIQSTNTVLVPLQQVFTMKEISISEIHQVDFPIVFIRTGGTEHRFKEIFPRLINSGKPITLLSTHTHNSLPASLEILYWLFKNGIKNTLFLHGPIESLVEKINMRARHIEIAEALTKMTVGVIGKPSDWLIASDIDYDKVQRRWGLSFTPVPLEEVSANFDMFSEAVVNETLSQFPLPGYSDGPGDREVAAAVRIYLALKKIASDYQLSALTLRCFDLLKPLNTTGCLALARLNDEGFPSGCEGDIPALFTMIMNGLLTGSPAFMANPSQIGADGIIFAHCTVPTRMVPGFGYKTHFESGIGIGISGRFPEGAVTISKINGEGLDYYYAAAGETTPLEDSPHLCRTQVKIIIPTGYDYFFNSPLGNHHILSLGNHTKPFVELMNYFSAVKLE